MITGIEAARYGRATITAYLLRWTTDEILPLRMLGVVVKEERDIWLYDIV